MSNYIYGSLYICVCPCMHSYLGHIKGISSEEVIVFYDGNMYEIPRPVRCKNRENYTSKRNNHT